MLRRMRKRRWAEIQNLLDDTEEDERGYELFFNDDDDAQLESSSPTSNNRILDPTPISQGERIDPAVLFTPGKTGSNSDYQEMSHSTIEEDNIDNSKDLGGSKVGTTAVEAKRIVGSTRDSLNCRGLPRHKANSATATEIEDWESQIKLIVDVVVGSIFNILKPTLPQEDSDLKKAVKFLESSKLRKDHPKYFFDALKALKDDPNHAKIIVSLSADVDKEQYVRYAMLNEDE